MPHTSNWLHAKIFTETTEPRRAKEIFLPGMAHLARRGAGNNKASLINLKKCTDKGIIVNYLRSLGGVEHTTRSDCTERNHFCIEKIAFFRRNPGVGVTVGPEIRPAGNKEWWMTKPSRRVCNESMPATVWYGVGVGKGFESGTFKNNKYQNVDREYLILPEVFARRLRRLKRKRDAAKAGLASARDVQAPHSAGRVSPCGE